MRPAIVPLSNAKCQNQQWERTVSSCGKYRMWNLFGRLFAPSDRISECWLCICRNSRSALYTNSVSWTVNINASLPSIIRISHVSYWWGVVRSGQWILQFDVELSRWFSFSNEYILLMIRVISQALRLQFDVWWCWRGRNSMLKCFRMCSNVSKLFPSDSRSSESKCRHNFWFFFHFNPRCLLAKLKLFPPEFPYFSLDCQLFFYCAWLPIKTSLERVLFCLLRDEKWK